jgi:penicillin-binding protein 1A
MAGGSRTLVVGLFVFALVAAGCNLPSLEEARKDAHALPQTSAIYSADGRLITRLHAGENRIVVGSRKIPDVMRNAVIAIEDKRFYDHRGVDARALLRAAYIDATTGEIVEGGSTITQQLVKQLYVGNEQSITRKVREAYLAWQLEKKLTKDQILTRYLNTVYFGNGAYGIRAASQTYFSEEPLDLTLPQAALLAGLIAAPVNYDPVIHPMRAERRRDHVLELMEGLGTIDAEQQQRAD